MSRYLTILALLYIVSQSSSVAFAQTGDVKKALHEHYRQILCRHTRLHHSERKMRKALYGNWETLRDTTTPKNVFARKKLPKDAAIQVHGIHYGKKGTATLYYTVGDSLKHVPWMWNVQKDTIFYGVALPHMMGDTIVIKEQVTAINKHKVELRNVGRDTITAAVLCGESPLMHTSKNSIRPEYSGDLQQYLDKGFESFNTDKDYIRAALSFMVNCNGEVLKVYGYPSSYNEFERYAAKLIRNTGKWIPATWGGKAHDAQVYLDIVWNRGFIDIEFLNGNN